MSVSNATKQAQARDLKHRVLTCLHKLSDRDTHTAAASELESIAKTLTADALPSFISSISATDSSDKSPVRRQCIRLFEVLSEHHGNSLSPLLSKVLSAVVRRLRDPDSSVRAACVTASHSLASRLSSPPFTSITKPFLESLFLEQDPHTQNGAALCLAAIIDGSRNPDVASLRKLLPRLEKLAKCESFKAKAAVLALIGSVVGVKGVLSKTAIKNLIMCLMEILASEDWAARKAAAEALIKIATVEKDVLSEYKTSCLKTFEARRFDKVKAARETMNQMIEAWKEIPDQLDEVSPPSESQASSREIASDGRYPPRTSISHTSPQPKKIISPLEDQASGRKGVAQRRSSIGGNENRMSPPLFQKLERKKLSNVKVEPLVSEDNPLNVDGKPLAKSEIKRALFDEKQTGAANVCRHQTDCEDLSRIRRQLAQIETQQSNLLELLQRFIGSSQNGIHSLEARVHGLELVLDEISFDLAASRNDASVCCKLPGTEFLSSKLWRKAKDHPAASRFPASVPGNTPLQNRRYLLRGGGGLVLNPLAEIPRATRGIPEVSVAE